MMREGSGAVTSEFADASFRPSQVSLVHPANSLPSHWTSYKYDEIGRIAEERAPDGSVSKIQHSVGKSTTTDALGFLIVKEHNGVDRVSAVFHQDGSMARYAYDAVGRLVLAKDSLGYESKWTWSSLGRLIETSDPDRGVRKFSYWPDGEVREEVDSLGQRSSWFYDRIGRLTEQRGINGNGKVRRRTSWFYDQGAAQHNGYSQSRLLRTTHHEDATTVTREYWYDIVG